MANPLLGLTESGASVDVGGDPGTEMREEQGTVSMLGGWPQANWPISQQVMTSIGELLPENAHPGSSWGPGQHRQRRRGLFVSMDAAHVGGTSIHLRLGEAS